MNVNYVLWLFTVAIATCTVCHSAADDKKEKKKKLQIGVKKRVEPEDCKMKSRKNDVLKMHYTVNIHIYFLVTCI